MQSSSVLVIYHRYIYFYTVSHLYIYIPYRIWLDSHCLVLSFRLNSIALDVLLFFFLSFVLGFMTSIQRVPGLGDESIRQSLIGVSLLIETNSRRFFFLISASA